MKISFAAACLLRLILLSILAWPAAAAAQTPPPAGTTGATPAPIAAPVPLPRQKPSLELAVPERLVAMTTTLDAIADTLQHDRLDETGLLALRRDVELVRTTADQLRSAAKAKTAENQGLLDALGPTPDANAPPEAAALAEQRRTLTQAVAQAAEQVRQADFITARAQGLIDRIDRANQQVLTENLLHRSGSILSYDVLTQIPAQLSAFAVGTVASGLDWWSTLQREQQRRTPVWFVILVALGAILALVLGLRALDRHWGRTADIAAPTFSRVLAAAVVESLRWLALPAFVIGGSLWLAQNQRVLFGDFGAMVEASLLAVLRAIIVIGAVRVTVAPGLPAWRLLPLRPESAVRMYRLVMLAAGVSAIYELVIAIARAGVPYGEALNALFSTILGSIFAVLIYTFSNRTLWVADHLPPVLEQRTDDDTAAPATVENQPASHLWPVVLWVARAVAILMPTATLLGYYGLVGFVERAVIESLLALAVYLSCRLIAASILDRLAASDHRLAQKVRAGMAFGGDFRLHRLWLGWLIEITLFITAAVCFLLIWGVPVPVILDRARLLIQGVQVGGITISIIDILIAAIVVIVVVVATQSLKRWLQDSVLPETRLDSGVQNSIVAGAGYVGYVVAGTLAVGALGLNLSNIAIIAGALSVGIGFGLQNIVNNFVSGIILLIERPIKVGDWVVVGTNEGYVRRISVRATEVETFQRAAMIIPNSEFISQRVVNVTYRDKQGRAEITIGVGYDSNVERVRDILLQVMDRHPEIAIEPPPLVLFRDFGDSALIFWARGFIDNVERRGAIESDLRFAILHAFRDEGIDIPYPQRTVYMRHITEGGGQAPDAAVDQSKDAATGA